MQNYYDTWEKYSGEIDRLVGKDKHYMEGSTKIIKEINPTIVKTTIERKKYGYEGCVRYSTDHFEQLEMRFLQYKHTEPYRNKYDDIFQTTSSMDESSFILNFLLKEMNRTDNLNFKEILMSVCDYVYSNKSGYGAIDIGEFSTYYHTNHFHFLTDFPNTPFFKRIVSIRVFIDTLSSVFYYNYMPHNTLIDYEAILDYECDISV